MINVLRSIKHEMALAKSGGLWITSSVIGRMPSRILRHILYRHLLRLDLAPTAKIHKGLEIILRS